LTGRQSKDGAKVNDVVVTSLIAALSAIITAAITAYIQLSIAKINADIERERIKAGTKKEKAEENKKREPGRKKEPLTVEVPTQLKPKINWTLTISAALLVGAVIFFAIPEFGDSTSKPPERTSSTISLSDAKVEFGITIGANIQSKTPYSTLTLQNGDQISIETHVTDPNGTPYQHDLEFTYFFASGGQFSGKIAPYTAKQPNDIITVQIKDEVTGETITSILRVHVN
jgi:hypothetical protein